MDYNQSIDFYISPESVAIHGLDKKNTSGGSYFVRPNPWIFVSAEQARAFPI